MVPAGVLFARLFHVIDMWWYYRQFPERIIGFAGFSIYGAILGAILGLWLYCRVARLNFGHFVDVLTPAIIVGQMIGRVGCVLNGCCHGTITTLPWAIVYTDDASHASVGYPYHPWPIYEIAVLLLILGMVIRLKPRMKPAGSLFALYLAAYAAWRFTGGFLRPEAPFILGLQQPQVVALVVLALTVSFLWRKTFRRKMPSG
jgi:phosphatidylglycerol:prolipoprotein diacylglycerol transferase